MNQLPDFKIVDDYAEYRPSGHVSLSEMVQMIAVAIAFAREQNIRKLLVVTIGLTGFEPPALADRYFFVQEWAKASSRIVRAAFVAHLEMIDSERFGVAVAANHGFTANIFDKEDQALTWLQSGK